MHETHSQISCRSGYFESIIHSYWKLQSVCVCVREREKSLTTGVKWNNFSYSITPAKMEILSQAHNLHIGMARPLIYNMRDLR